MTSKRHGEALRKQKMLDDIHACLRKSSQNFPALKNITWTVRYHGAAQSAMKINDRTFY